MVGPVAIACTLVAALLAPQSADRRPLKALLADIGLQAGVQIKLAAPLEDEVIVDPRRGPTDASNLEEHLRIIANKITLGGRVVKLYLPKGRNWTAEELLAYAEAEAELFGKAVPDSKPDVVNILAQPMSPQQAKPAIDSIGLKPIYIIALRGDSFAGTCDTTYGEMKLIQNGNKVSGTYTTNRGRIEGFVQDGVFQMTWFEEGNGSNGYGSFKLAGDGMSFSGPWYNTGIESPAGTWTGRRKKSQ